MKCIRTVRWEHPQHAVLSVRFSLWFWKSLHKVGSNAQKVLPSHTLPSYSKDPLTNYFHCLTPAHQSQRLRQIYPTSYVLFYPQLFPLCNEDFSFLVLYHLLNNYLFILYFFFTLCKISSHYTRSLITESRPGLAQYLQYKLTHCKDHCWLLLNPEPFTTTARRQAPMRWHCLNICLLLSRAQSAQPWWELPPYNMLERVLTGCLLVKSIPRQGRCQTVVAQT